MLKKKIKSWGFIKDPIHGYIIISEDDKKIIDTREFQRLHRIKQLPLADYVYPGAVHTRFEHSLGVMHLATSIMENLPLEIDEDEAKLIRTASLLHDIGHGPFSHLFESITLSKLNMNHEEIGKRIISESQISDILKDLSIEPIKIGYIITGERVFLRKFLHQITNSGIDADKLDFIKRDNYHSGAGYGGIDVDRLVNTMEVFNDELAVNSTALLTFELFIMARIKSFEAIYYHKTIRAAQLLLLKGIEKTFEEFGFMNSFNAEEYLSLDDYRLWVEISRSKEGKKYLEKLETRDLLKNVYERKFLIKYKREELMKMLEEIKHEIAKISEVNSESIFVDLSTLPSVPYHNAYISDPFEIPIFDNKKNKIEKFSSYSPWISSLKGYLNILRIYTYKELRDRVSNVCQRILEKYPLEFS
jgi:HD superfamily phosphohydrolase